MLDVAIIGAGLSGLSAAYHLQSMGYQVVVLEATGKVGGRCKSDYLDGFILDRGLHFFQKDLVELKSLLDYNSLRMEAVYPGAMLYFNSNFYLVSNLVQKFKDSLSFAISPFMTFKDKFNMAKFLGYLMSSSEESFQKLKDVTTLEFLKSRGFSDMFVQSFFKPLNKAIYADDSLKTPACVFASTMKYSTFGGNMLPAYGIGSVAVQLAEKLEEGTVRLLSRVTDIQANRVELATGEVIQAKNVIVSTPPHEIEKMMSDYQSDVKFNTVACMYFATTNPPVNQPILLLNGEGKGLVNNIFVPSNIQRSYAPPGSHLVSVTLKDFEGKDEGELIDDVLRELIGWFGIKVNDWTHLKTYHIKNALPRLEVGDEHVHYQKNNGVYFCGDYLSYASVGNAIMSGKNVAEALSTEHPIENRKPKSSIFSI